MLEGEVVGRGVVRREGDVVRWVAVLGCDAQGEAWVGEESVDCWRESAGFVDGEGTVLVEVVSIELCS